jgi:hypothetical protein
MPMTRMLAGPQAHDSLFGRAARLAGGMDAGPVCDNSTIMMRPPRLVSGTAARPRQLAA